MARKVIRTQNSDGTWSETTEQRKAGGCMTAFAWVFGTIFVVAIGIAYPYMWALYIAVILLAIYGKRRKEKNG